MSDMKNSMIAAWTSENAKRTSSGQYALLDMPEKSSRAINKHRQLHFDC